MICEKTFHNFTCLQSIIAPNLVYVGDSAFAGCVSLTIDFVENAVVIAANAFAYAGAGDVVVTDASSIGANAFAHSNIYSFKAPQITIAGDAVFEYSSLKFCEMPEIRRIPYRFLSNCENLVGVKFNSATVAEKDAFINCCKLESVQCTVKTIKARAFMGTSALKTLNTSMVSSVDAAAFMNSGLTEANMPHLTKANVWSFAYCKNLKRVRMCSLLYVEMFAFYHTGITMIYIPSVLHIKPHGLSYVSTKMHICMGSDQIHANGAANENGNGSPIILDPHAAVYSVVEFMTTTRPVIMKHHCLSLSTIGTINMPNLALMEGFCFCGSTVKNHLAIYGNLCDFALAGGTYNTISVASSRLGNSLFNGSKANLIELYRLQTLPNDCFDGTKVNEIYSDSAKIGTKTTFENCSADSVNLKAECYQSSFRRTIYAKAFPTCFFFVTSKKSNTFKLYHAVWVLHQLRLCSDLHGTILQFMSPEWLIRTRDVC